MKVKDLVAKLQEFDPELPVCVADWQEQYRNPSEGAAEIVTLVKDGLYFPTGPIHPFDANGERGTYICIGD